MKKNLLLIPLSMAVLGVSSPTHAEGGGSASITGDCSAVKATVAGFPDGSRVFFSIGSEPPYGFDVGTPDPWGRFTASNGVYSGTIEPGAYNVAHAPFSVFVDVIADGVDSRIASASIDCTTAPAVASAAVMTAMQYQEDDPAWDCTTMGNKVCGPTAAVESPVVHEPEFRARFGLS